MLRHRSSAAKLLIGAVLFLAGCADTGSEAPTGPGDLLNQDQIPADVVCGETSSAEDLIDCLFPRPGLRGAAQKQLANIERQYAHGEVEAATGMMFDLVDFTLSKLDQLLDPQPLGQHAAVSLLIDALFETVEMESPDIPDGSLTRDGAISVVSALGGSVFTGSRLFGLEFEENAFESDALVTLSRLSDPGVSGAGPLPTELDQYGPFYHMQVHPAVESINGVRAGLCYYASGPLAPPYDPAVRAGLRIARTVPGSDDDYKFKILASADPPPFLDCSDVTQLASVRRRDARALARLGARLGSILAWALGPAPLSAGSNGGATDTILVRGGRVLAGDMGTVDPNSGGPPPDLVVVSLEVIPAIPVEGLPFTIQAVVKNIGEGAARGSFLRFHEAGTGAVDALVPVNALAPQQSEAVSSSAYLSAGLYEHLTAYADDPDDVGESDEGNNEAALTFTVVASSNLSGHVWVDGTGVPGVSVLATNTHTLGTMTDAGGAYFLSSLDPGTYTVSISPPPDADFPITSRTVTVASGETAVVDFSGSSLWDSPVGTGPAMTWTVTDPASAMSLCNGSGASPCAVGGSTVPVTATATGPSGMFTNPWVGGSVYFYYIHPDLGPFFIGVVGGGLGAPSDDNVTRFYTWTTSFDALGIPVAATPGQFVAVGVDSGHTPYATPPNGSALIVAGTLGGDE